MNVTMNASDFFHEIMENGNSYKTSYQKRATAINSVNREAHEDVKDLRKRLKKLEDYDKSSISSERMKKQLKGFIKGYNQLSKSAEEVEQKDFSKTMKSLEQLVHEHEKELKKAGVAMVDGELVFDSVKFEKAEAKHFEKICNGKDSFLEEAAKLTRKAYRQSGSGIYFSEMRKYFDTCRYTEAQVAAAGNAEAATRNMKNLGSSCAAYEAGAATLDEAGKQILQYLEEFAEYYNYDMQELESDYVVANAVKQREELTKREDISALLQKAGLTISEEGVMSLEADVTIDDAFMNTCKSLFGEGAEYRTKMHDYAGKIFKHVLSTDTIGVVINEYL